MISNKKNMRILEDNPPVIKRINECIVQSSKRIDENKSYVYKRLNNGFQFGGILNENFDGNGDAIVINNNQEYYLSGCSIMNGVVHCYKQKRNLISNCQIVENAIPDLTLEQLVAKLYTQYLSKEIDHRVILFFTPQTNQFLKNNNISDHEFFRKAYKNYVVIFIHLNDNESSNSQYPNSKFKQQQYAFILRNGKVDFLCNNFNLKVSSEFDKRTNFLKQMKYEMNYTHSCPCIYQDIGINPNNLNISQSQCIDQSLNQSITNLAHLFSSRQFTPKYEQQKTNNGYFIIPLIVKAFDLNKLDKQDIDSIVRITNQLYLRKCHSIYQRVESILQNKIQIYRLQQMLNDLNTRIQKDKNPNKFLFCSKKI